MIECSPLTFTARVSLLTPARLKATHSTVILLLENATVRTLSTSTAPYSSLWTSTVGARRGIASCSPVLFSLHLHRERKAINWQKHQCLTLSQREITKITTVCVHSQGQRLGEVFYAQLYLRGSDSKTLIPDDSGRRIAMRSASKCGYIFPFHDSNWSLCEWEEMRGKNNN